MPHPLQGASKAHEFAATLGRGSREFLVAVRTEGQFVGEMAWFALGAVRCATIRAKGPVRVKIIPGERLDDIVNRVPEVSHHRLAVDSTWGACRAEVMMISSATACLRSLQGVVQSKSRSAERMCPSSCHAAGSVISWEALE